ncbi:hypothetical protein MINTM020_01350 [Mycobacterium paraintracellulare]|nr:hypothetical protein MINTM020_01350 [Mycobacterium paraintracellulare]
MDVREVIALEIHVNGELPIARDVEAPCFGMVIVAEVVARQRFRDAVEGSRDIDVIRQTDDDQSGLLADGQWDEATLLQFRTGEHFACGRACETAIEAIGPTVVGALEDSCPAAVGDNLRAAMGAPVDEGLKYPVPSPRD